MSLLFYFDITILFYYLIISQQLTCMNNTLWSKKRAHFEPSLNLSLFNRSVSVKGLKKILTSMIPTIPINRKAIESPDSSKL